jgi:hypothetical protein
MAGQLSPIGLIDVNCSTKARLFAVAVVIDIIYQVIVFRWIYPGQALIVAAIVAFPSYLLLRGPANRLARYWLGSGHGT